MQTLGARLVSVAPGLVQIELDFSPGLTQQHGYLHAGSEVLSVEYKVNFMSPGRGERFLASGRVVKVGRTLTICSGEVLAFRGSVETTVALMQATMMRIQEKVQIIS